MAGSAIIGWLSLALLASMPAKPVPEPTPDVELLLYFGEFEDASGDFIDPLALEAAAEDVPDANAVDELTRKSEDEQNDARDR